MINLQDILLTIYKKILDSITTIEAANSKILGLEYIQESIEARKIFMDDQFLEVDSKRKKELENITLYLMELKDACINNQNILASSLNSLGEEEIDLDEVVKDDKLFFQLYQDGVIEIKESTYEYKYILQEIAHLVNIRIFIHQALNILGQSSNIFVAKVLQKEQLQGKIKKTTSDLVGRLMISNSNVKRLYAEYKLLLNLNEDAHYKLEKLSTQRLMNYIVSYQDRLSTYYYNGKSNQIILNIDSRINDEVFIKVDIFKYLEIIEVILFNASEELCNKEEESGERVNKTILIQIYVENNNLILRIKDSGRGIPDPEKIFSLNYTTKKDKGGSGLGLAAAIKIATDLDINISVNTKVPKGSTFYIFKELV